MDKATSNTKLTDEQIITRTPKTVYYCNCCGYTFQSDDDMNEIRCPNCDCLFDPENGFIEKSVVY